MGYIIGVDTGGTFTDGVLVDTEGDIMIRVKVVTTPYDLTECFLDLLERIADRLGIDLPTLLVRCESIRYSQTIATNTLITKTGTRLGLIVTKGYEGDLYSGVNDPALFNFVDRSLVIGVDEDIDSSGKVAVPLSNADGLAAVEELIDRGAREIVVVLKNSYVNPVHEEMILQLVKEEYPPHYLGRMPVYLSKDIARARDDYLRCCTSVINAYVHRRMATYLYKAEDYVRSNGYARPLFLVTSDGTLSTVPWTKGISTIGSGPAAGVLGAYFVARRLYDHQRVVTVDMGGTSLDIGYVTEGSPIVRYYSSLEGVKVFQPMINVESIALGGGSIITVTDGEIRVGPKSAGSTPGPACFDRGGEYPTPTDANLLLGYLNPKNFMGGAIPLNVEKAAEAIKRVVCDHLGLSVEEASIRIRTLVNQIAARSVKSFLERQGPSSKIAVYIYGGAGGLHACSIISNLGRHAVGYVFGFSSAFSAMGCCTLDIGHHYYVELSRDADMKLLLNELLDRARRDLEGEGFFMKNAACKATVYNIDNDSVTELPLNQGSMPNRMDVGILVIRAIIPSPKPAFVKMPEETKDPLKALKGRRSVYWDDLGPIETPVYEMSKLRPGNVVEGPAIIEAEDTTVPVEEGFTYTVDVYNNGRIEIQDETY
ncbi:MAG: hydantoinase/oxoprolinase family protein [Aigarchaeota archaeon]|nr:hydantoinase/oxoprolinase family protein [Aigarchaeota archaeon]MDW8092795.1 hydantoinase/oxoprolinase family protein [Nitrososphaerota archaeon]